MRQTSVPHSLCHNCGFACVNATLTQMCICDSNALLPGAHVKLKVSYYLLYQHTAMCSSPASIKCPEMEKKREKSQLPLELTFYMKHAAKKTNKLNTNTAVCDVAVDYDYPNILEQLFTPHTETTLKPPCFCPHPNMWKVQTEHHFPPSETSEKNNLLCVIPL